MTKIEMIFGSLLAVILVFSVITTSYLYTLEADYELKKCEGGCLVISLDNSYHVEEFLSHD